MEKRVLEKLMFGTMTLFIVLLPVGWYLELPMIVGSAITLGILGMIVGMEIHHITERHKKLERKYKRGGTYYG